MSGIVFKNVVKRYGAAAAAALAALTADTMRRDAP